MVPLVGQGVRGRVRRVLEHVVGLVGPARFDGAISSRMAIMASQKRSSSGLAFALGGLDHQRAGHGEGHGGRVEAVVHQALGDVLDLDAGGLLELAAVEDHLVGHGPLLPA